MTREADPGPAPGRMRRNERRRIEVQLTAQVACAG
jgi:hypothetical protein